LLPNRTIKSIRKVQDSWKLIWMWKR
jgi:hypothetical protein